MGQTAIERAHQRRGSRWSGGEPSPPSALPTRRRITLQAALSGRALDSPATANERRSRTTPATTPNKTQSHGENTGSSTWFGQKFGFGQPGALLRNAVHRPINTPAGTDAVRRTLIALVSRDMSSITMAAATPKSAHCQSANRGPGLHNQNAAQDDELGGLIVTDIPAVQRPTPTPTGTDARRATLLRVGLIPTMLPRPGVPVAARIAQAQGLNSASLIEVDLRMLAYTSDGAPGLPRLALSRL